MVDSRISWGDVLVAAIDACCVVGTGSPAPDDLDSTIRALVEATGGARRAYERSGNVPARLGDMK